MIMQTIVLRFLQYSVLPSRLSSKMQFSTALIALTATILPVIAMPTAEAEAAPGAVLEKRANTVFVCSGESVVLSPSSFPFIC